MGDFTVKQGDPSVKKSDVLPPPPAKPLTAFPNRPNPSFGIRFVLDDARTLYEINVMQRAFEDVRPLKWTNNKPSI